jgi:hypothetical protein
LEVSRASNVEYNHITQEWEATVPSGEIIARGKNRDEVIKREVAVITARLQEQIEKK